MELRQHKCQGCGGDLKLTALNHWKCDYCGNEYDEQAAEQNTAVLRAKIPQCLSGHTMKKVSMSIRE